MTKEEILKDFLNNLMISFKNASIYGAEHPAFSKSIIKLKHKIDALFKFLIPISLGFTSNSVYLDGRFWEKGQLFLEVAKIFHFRKLKNIKIYEGITTDELVYFITRLSISPKDVIKIGGPNRILIEEEIPHISFEELDYSELLKGEGKDIKDIWLGLLQEALETQNDKQILELSDTFEKVIKAFEFEEITESDELIEAISGFFGQLKNLESQKFKECTKEFVRTIMKHKKPLPHEKKEKFEQIINNFDNPDLATTVWEEILTDDSFDSLNFNIFTTLVKKERHEGVAYHMSNIFRKNEPLRSNPKVKDKMEELLSDITSSMISDIYRNTLAILLREIDYKEELSFHQDILSVNYRFMLLNLIDKEQDTNQVMTLLNKLFKEWKTITDQKDYEFLKATYAVMKEKDKDLAADTAFKKMKNQLVNFIEMSILQGELSFYFVYFIETIEQSTLDVNVYLEHIFTQTKVTPYTLRAFFKFFKEYLFYFNLNLDEYSADRRFIEKMIENIGMIDSPISWVTLKYIFQQGERGIKIKVLQAMQNLSRHDSKFLIPILKSKDFHLKSEAFYIMMQDKDLSNEILQKLLSISSPFGIRNKQLYENLRIIQEKKVSTAKPYLLSLSKRRYFFNRKLREQANGILEKWNAEPT